MGGGFEVVPASCSNQPQILGVEACDYFTILSLLLSFSPLFLSSLSACLAGSLVCFSLVSLVSLVSLSLSSLCVCVRVRACAHSVAHVWTSEYYNIQKLILSFYLGFWGLQSGLQACEANCCYSLSHLEETVLSLFCNAPSTHRLFSTACSNFKIPSVCL